jgi:hypothetical protein
VIINRSPRPQIKGSSNWGCFTVLVGYFVQYARQVWDRFFYQIYYFTATQPLSLNRFDEH